MDATKKDKKLLMEVLRHPATVFYRDEKILVLKPHTMDSYVYYTNGVIRIPDARLIGEKEALKGAHVVRTHRNETFVLRITEDAWERSMKFEFCVSTPNSNNRNVMNTKDATAELIDKYPSLYQAFGDVAKKNAYLPLIENQSDDDITRALKKGVENVAHVKNLTHKRKMRIVEQYPDSIKYMEQNIELCMHTIRKSGGAQLKNVNEDLRTEKLCYLAVVDDGMAIGYVPSHLQTTRLCMEAVKRNGMALGKIQNPSLEVCIAAVNKTPDAWKFIKDEKLKKKVQKLRTNKRFR